MDQVIPNLWVGDLQSALNKAGLEEHNVKYVMSAMRGRVRVDPRFVRYQINLDDTNSADLLVHLPPAIAFIDSALQSGKGVLVHCQAGMSRSASIVAAFLMYSKNINLNEALDLMRSARPIVCPNDSFMRQLELFHKVSCKITPRDKATRAYYLERTVTEVLNGDGSPPETDMFARYPRTPTASAPATPGGPRRRIRCKMCRQELATREHMLDHGQPAPSTPASNSRRPSESTTMYLLDPNPDGNLAATPPSTSRRISPTEKTHAPIRRSSLKNEIKPSAIPGLTMSTIKKPPSAEETSANAQDMSSSALQDSEDEEGENKDDVENRPLRAAALSETVMSRSGPPSRHGSFGAGILGPEAMMSAVNAKLAMTYMSRSSSSNAISLGSSSSEGDLAGPSSTTPSDTKLFSTQDEMGNSSSPLSYYAPAGSTSKSSSLLERALPSLPPPRRISSNISGVPPSNSILANLKLSMPVGSPTSPAAGALGRLAGANTSPLPSPPILQNAKCSGYFLEPMKWMEPALESGQIAGKIICPNKKCNAKLGNYDWAGIHCSCKEWVTPGFCIHRSKVDEVW
ncbi:hypothetical protein FRC02_010231 [Tulasnella sp. 418]|nr:hypothetical protein FRC02_010231 [Tulasnella sp. 418]